MPATPTRPRRTRPRILVATLVVLAIACLPALGLVPKTKFAFGPTIEGLAPYAGQKTCSPSAKPGTTAFANLLLRTYPRSSSLGIVRSCNVGGTSEHKEGRAFDWGMNYYDATERKQVNDLMRWLLKTDRHGNRWANARRLGIQYMIWNNKIWGAYRASAGWRPYTGGSAHRDHVHFSLSWNGARGQTSFWNKTGFPLGGSVVDPTPGAGGGDTTPGIGDHSFPDPEPDATRNRMRRIPEPTPEPALMSGSPITEEFLNVSSRARRGTLTKGAMIAGRKYLLEVSGTYRYAKARTAKADAECATAPRSDWRRSRSIRDDAWYADHLDLYVDGRDLYADADNGQECDGEAHTYRWVYTAQRDGRVPFTLWDPTSYKNNRGQLTVHVVDLSRVSETAQWRVPSKLPAGRSSGVALRGGQDYEVTVSSGWNDGSGVIADAECTRQLPGTDWVRNRFPADFDQYDVLVGRLGRDGLVPRRSTISGRSVAGGECDAAGHTYTFLWRSEDTMPLNVRVHDPKSYRDNAGGVLVSVKPYDGPRDAPDPDAQTETLMLDAATPAETLSSDWDAGTRLRITVEGTYRLRDGREWIEADAECTNAWNDSRWRDQRVEGYVGGNRKPLGDVLVNGKILTWDPRDGGSCDADHVYSIRATTSEDGPLRFTVADDDFADNRGTLKITIAPR